MTYRIIHTGTKKIVCTEKDKEKAITRAVQLTRETQIQHYIVSEADAIEMLKQLKEPDHG